MASGHRAEQMPGLVPTGVYAIPELGMVGRTEEELTEAALPYVTGVARWSEPARGLISGDEDGMLKLLVSPGDRSAPGPRPRHGRRRPRPRRPCAARPPPGLDFLVSAVFNSPTFTESYKVAALDALNRMRALGILKPPAEAPDDEATQAVAAAAQGVG